MPGAGVVKMVRVFVWLARQLEGLCEGVGVVVVVVAGWSTRQEQNELSSLPGGKKADREDGTVLAVAPLPSRASSQKDVTAGSSCVGTWDLPVIVLEITGQQASSSRL